MHCIHCVTARLDHVLNDFKTSYNIIWLQYNAHVNKDVYGVQKLLTLTFYKLTQCVFPQNLFKAAKTITKVNPITTSGRTAVVQQTAPR